MRVHFSASLRRVSDHIQQYNLIAETIRSNGHEFLKDWLSENQTTEAAKRIYSDREWEDISSKTLQAVRKADAVIIDASTSSFSMGYQAALALSYRKPLLILFDSRYQQYIIDPTSSLKRAFVYHDDEELCRAVESFLKENDASLADLRFNMVLDRDTYGYLQWEATRTGKSKAEIIRGLVKERIRHSE